MNNTAEILAFFETLRKLGKREHIKVPCSNGSTLTFQKNNYPGIKVFYFEKDSISPCQVSDTNIGEIAKIVESIV